MKLEKLVGERFKERPADCVIDSHAIMVKGGYIKYMANGIYSSYLPLRRIVRKIEQILREEMDKIDGQEVQFPLSGRYARLPRHLPERASAKRRRMADGPRLESGLLHGRGPHAEPLRS